MQFVCIVVYGATDVSQSVKIATKQQEENP